MFTKEEALAFISQNLEVHGDIEQRFENDRKNLLDEIVTNFQTHLLFQNLRLLQNVPEKRHRPSLDETKADILSGVGGLCYNLNITAYYLLKAVGFKSTLAHATCMITTVSTDTHVVVYVEDVEKAGDKFLVEVGFGFPTFRAISMDFDYESPQFKDSFLEYKYVKYEGKILRMHRNCEIIGRKQSQDSVDGNSFVIDGWRRFYYANPEGCNSLEDFYPHFDQVFTDPTATPFHLTFRVISFAGKKAVMVINEKTLIENDKGELVPTIIEGGDAGIVETVRHHFPALPEDLVRQALTSWRQTT